MAEMAIRRVARGVRRRVRGPAREVPPTGSIEKELAPLEAVDRRIVERALPYTMTGVPRLAALVGAVRYCVRRGVPGALAECGVWRGGSVLAMALTLVSLIDGHVDAHVHSFETSFYVLGGEPVLYLDGRGVQLKPGACGCVPVGVPHAFRTNGSGLWIVHVVAGSVEETLPRHAPEALALLRLDTDWYESTRHELEHLYPRLAAGGVLIVDDYGHWKGARRAVDEYFASKPPLLLSPIDYTARIAVKH